MDKFLSNKHIVLGVCGSIAAYKSAELIRRLRESGALVRVVMTENAKKFITPLSLQALSGNPVHHLLCDEAAEAAMDHISLARWADMVLIAPASANCIAHLAHGEASSLLSALCLVTRAPIVIAPAMNQSMWLHPILQQNIQKLLNHQVQILHPEVGDQACGEHGPGRMMEPLAIISQLKQLFFTSDLSQHHVLITAGPTHEAIDPVRFLSNKSSGRMGFALAQAALNAGADVTLISGPVHLTPPANVNFIPVITAEQMYQAVHKCINEVSVFISVAAVADYACAEIAAQKISKNADHLILKLVKNPDIVASVGQLKQKPFIVGFAAETENLIARAQWKRQHKNMDMIIANLVSEGKAIGTVDNAVTVIDKDSSIELQPMAKTTLATHLISLIAKKLGAKIYDKHSFSSDKLHRIERAIE